MCLYQLNICPYPNRDTFAAIVSDSSKSSGWKPCSLPRPWGQLSCGDLCVYHYVPELRRQSSDFDPLPTPSDYLFKGVHNHSPTTIPADKFSPSNITSEVASLSDLANHDLAGDTSLNSSSITNDTIPSESSANGGVTRKCQWCSAIITLVAYKSRQIQSEALGRIAAMEHEMDTCLELRALRKMIASKEAEIGKLKAKAWLISEDILKGVENSKG